MAHPNPRVERPYRGLYAGISEIAQCLGVSKQCVSHDLRPLLPTPLGFLMPNDRRPYWFLRDALTALRGHGRVITLPPTSGDIEDWEYRYHGPIVGVTGFAKLGGIPTGNVHSLTIAWGEPVAADHLLMGTLWRADDAMRTLAARGYPKKVA